MPDQILNSEGIQPGTWDNGQLAQSLRTALSSGSSTRTLYNVSLLGGEGDADCLTTLMHFDQLSLSDLSSISLTLSADDLLRLVASTSPSGLLDLALSIGDPTVLDNQLIPVSLGTIVANLEMDTGNGYTMIDSISINSVAVPEPATIALLAPGLLCLAAHFWRRCKRTA